jgi:uncharacterized protein YbjT (DUF2867 family)
MQLVIGGTGTVGTQVVLALVAAGQRVRVMTRSADKLGTLPREAEGVTANLEEPATLPPAFKGVDGVFLLNALGPNETEQGLAAVRAATQAGVKRLVYMSVVMPPGCETIPHFASKMPVEQAVKDSGIPWTILRPNNFFQNDFWLRQAIVSYGVYPQPIGGVGLNRTDVRDVADAAVKALTRRGFDGRTYDLHGPDLLTGEGVAAIYSRHLDREIRYGGDDLEAWEAQAKQMLPESIVHDFKIMYAFFQKHGMKASAADLQETRDIAGHEPRSFAAFVQEVAPHWKV